MKLNRIMGKIMEIAILKNLFKEDVSSIITAYITMLVPMNHNLRNMIVDLAHVILKNQEGGKNCSKYQTLNSA